MYFIIKNEKKRKLKKIKYALKLLKFIESILRPDIYLTGTNLNNYSNFIVKYTRHFGTRYCIERNLHAFLMITARRAINEGRKDS